MKLSEFVQGYRKMHKMSLRDLAKRCGCSFQYLSKIEKNEVSSPGLDAIAKIAKGTGVTIQELLEQVDNLGLQLSPDGTEKVTVFKKVLTPAEVEERDNLREELIELVSEISFGMSADEVHRFIRIVEAIYR